VLPISKRKGGCTFPTRKERERKVGAKPNIFHFKRGPLNLLPAKGRGVASSQGQKKEKGGGKNTVLLASFHFRREAYPATEGRRGKFTNHRSFKSSGGKTSFRPDRERGVHIFQEWNGAAGRLDGKRGGGGRRLRVSSTFLQKEGRKQPKKRKGNGRETTIQPSIHFKGEKVGGKVANATQKKKKKS